MSRKGEMTIIKNGIIYNVT